MADALVKAAAIDGPQRAPREEGGKWRVPRHGNKISTACVHACMHATATFAVQCLLTKKWSNNNQPGPLAILAQHTQLLLWSAARDYTYGKTVLEK